jgi:hypothetical protein
MVHFLSNTYLFWNDKIKTPAVTKQEADGRSNTLIWNKNYFLSNTLKITGISYLE